MNRKQFLGYMSLLPAVGVASQLSSLNSFLASPNTATLPVLFLGHGSPMNAIEENEFVQGFRQVATTFEKPKAILVVSAHWETKGTWVTAMEHPRTIHDFGGFPKELFEVQYPAPGHPALANDIISAIKSTTVQADYQWGLDHGAWSVVKHLYPKADIPVLQLSIDYTKPAAYHFQLAQELKALRKKGVLIIGSGNMVHNLRMVAWDKLNEINYAFDWAQEASEKMKGFIKDGNFQPLVDYHKQGQAFQLAIPTPEHYYPLLYALGLKEKREQTQLFNDKAVAGSLTMTSVKISS